jgi:hypothetical protein
MGYGCFRREVALVVVFFGVGVVRGARILCALLFYGRVALYGYRY